MITVQGQRLRVAVRPGTGSGPPLLLVNGLGVNFEVLDPFVDCLDPEITVIRFDVPGTGGSPTPPMPLPLPMHAWLVARLLDRLGYRQVDVLGVSWGGTLAQQFACQYCWRCRRLILVSTGPGALTVPGRLTALRNLAALPRYTDPAALERVAGETFGGTMRSHPEGARRFAAAMRQGSQRGAFYQILGATGWTSLPWLPLLRQPTLILAGDDDPIVPAINARILHQLIPRARLHIFHDGHLGLMTQAPDLGKRVAAFLRDGAA